MLIGAHVSTRGGILNAVSNAAAIGAAVMQTHPTPGQQWRPLLLDDDTLEEYQRRYGASGLRGHYLHAVYLINLATPDAALLRRSIKSLVHYMELAAVLAADAVVLHTGSHMGRGFPAVRGQIAAALREVLEQSSESPAQLLIENSAGSGRCVGCSFEELGEILAAVASPRAGVCLDTQHLFASGYDIREPEHVAATLARFDAEVGFAHLRLVHANDSRVPLGSNVDRHANIGEGHIGTAAFRMLLGDERLRAVPWVLEVPGTDRGGPDLENLNRLRECASLAPVTVAAGAAAATRRGTAERPEAATRAPGAASRAPASRKAAVPRPAAGRPPTQTR